MLVLDVYWMTVMLVKTFLVCFVNPSKCDTGVCARVCVQSIVYELPCGQVGLSRDQCSDTYEGLRRKLQTPGRESPLSDM